MMIANTMRFLKRERNNRCIERKGTFQLCLLKASKNISIPEEKQWDNKAEGTNQSMFSELKDLYMHSEDTSHATVKDDEQWKMGKNWWVLWLSNLSSQESFQTTEEGGGPMQSHVSFLSWENGAHTLGRPTWLELSGQVPSSCFCYLDKTTGEKKKLQI